MKVLEFSADHFGYGTVQIREILWFSKNQRSKSPEIRQKKSLDRTTKSTKSNARNIHPPLFEELGQTSRGKFG